MAQEEKKIKVEGEESTEKKDNKTNENTEATKEEKHEEANQPKETEEKKEKEDDKQEPKEDPLQKLTDENARLKDQLLRTMAEFDNFRKRSLKEKQELIFNGSEKAITTILPVMDDMERAIANFGKIEDTKKVEEGWQLIFKKLTKALESLGVKKIDTKDADFSTDYHEAVAMVPGMGDDKKGKVIDCVQAGYTLNGKVIRHAKVAIGQ